MHNLSIKITLLLALVLFSTAYLAAASSEPTKAKVGCGTTCAPKSFIASFGKIQFFTHPFLSRAKRPQSDACTPSQSTEIFPTLSAKTLSGMAITAPDAAKQKQTLVGLAFSPKAETELKGWMQPLYDQFIAKQEGVFSASNFEGNFYMIAMLSGAASLAGKSLADKAKTKVDSELQPHIILYKGDAAWFAKAIGATDKSIPYFALIGPDGAILKVVQGAYTEEKLDAILELAE